MIPSGINSFHGRNEMFGMCISRKGDKVKDKDGENPVLMERIQKIKDRERKRRK